MKLKIMLENGSTMEVEGDEKFCFSLSKEIFKWPPRSLTVTAGGAPRARFRTSKVVATEFIAEEEECD